MKLRKGDTDILNVVCVAVNPLKERGDVLGGPQSKIEAILSEKQQAGFVVDGLVRAKELRCQPELWLVTQQGVNRFAVHYKVLIYLIAEFAGEAEEIGRHDRGRGAVDASSARVNAFFASCALQTLHFEN